MLPINDDCYERLPGLYRAFDFGVLLEEGRSYRIEDGGRTDDGQPLYMVFECPQATCCESTRHDA
jgi:hypothetical protein